MQREFIAKENKMGILNFLLIWFFFYIELLQGGIATHDELGNIANIIEGTANLRPSARWGMVLFHYPLDLLQGSMPNYTLYRLWTIFGLMIACASIMLVIYHHVDTHLCWIFPNVFVLLAQIISEHDGLLAFCWGYQLDVAFVFISIDCFILYKKTQMKKYKIASVITYFIATMAYEAFATFGFFLFLIDIIYMYSQKSFKFREIFNDLVLHFLAVFSYTVSFVTLSYRFDVGDATIGGETSIGGYLNTLISFSFGLFPLRFRFFSLKQLFSYAFVVTWSNAVLWMFIIFSCIFAVYYIRKSQPISIKTYIVYSMLGLVGTILPNLVISLVSKFQQWVAIGVKTFGTSYYSYFFWVFWIVVTAAFFYHRIKFKKCFTVIMFLIFAFSTRFTISSNHYYLNEMKENQNRYEAFMDIIKSDDFSELSENVQIYTSDYVGIHYNIDSLSDLAMSISGNPVKILNDKMQLDWNSPIYYLGYDQQKEIAYLCEMPLKYELGTELTFSASNNTAKDYCFSGFSSAEEEYTWTDSNVVDMKFHISNEKLSDMVLEYECVPYNMKQHVILYANDQKIADYDFTVGGTKEVLIPADYIKEEKLNLRFELPDAVSPKDLGVSEDSRTLGLAMKKLVIK